MNKQLIIPCTKCTLVLYENELFNGLKSDILMQALKRGKGYKRALNTQNRNETVRPKNESVLTGRN